MEVANDLVDLDAALETASLLTLGIKMLGVVFALTLLDALASTKGPRYGGVGVADFIAGITAAGLLCVGRGGSTVAFATVVGSKVGGFVLVSVAGISQCSVFAKAIVSGRLE